MSYEPNTNAQAEPSPKKLGRNTPCPCGSGDKFKRCCMEPRARGFTPNPAIAKAALRQWPKKFVRKAGVIVEL